MPAGHFYQFGEFRLDAAERILFRGDQHVPLPPKAIDILLLLVEQRGHLVEKEMLLQQVWPGTFVEENNLARNVSILRKLLTDGRDGKAFIETIPKRGYRFVAEVSETSVEAQPRRDELVPPAEMPQLPAPAAPRAVRKPARPFLLAGSAVALLALLAVVLNLGEVRDRISGYVGGKRIRSLAVLPLENLSGDPDQEYFAEGMTDALITDLAKIHSLRVVSRTSAVQYKSAHKPLSQIARELGVDAIVEGTISRSGSRVRVTAQLVRGDRESHVWADMYERDVGDSIAMQGEIAQAIADRIRAEVTPDERAKLSAARRVDPQVYELYLRGRYYWNKRDPEGLKKSMEYFQRAVDEDPNFALGYVGLADTYNVLSDSFLISPKEALTKSRIASTKALQLDDNLAEAHASLAFVDFQLDWDWHAAELEFHRAIELNPGYATAHHWYSIFLSAMGRCEESVGEFRRAEQLDPLSLIIRLDGAATFYWCRDIKSAIGETRQVLEMAPDYSKAHLYIAGLYLAKGMFDDCLSEYKRGMQLAGGNAEWTQLMEALVAASRGEAAESRRSLNQLTGKSQSVYLDPYYFAIVYAALKDRDAAFAYLDKAFEQHTYILVYLKVDMRMDNLRSDPRYAILLQRLHLS